MRTDLLAPTGAVGARVERVARRLGPVAGAVLLAPVVAVALPLWAVSVLTRWLSRQPFLEPRAFPDNLVEYAPSVGARPRAHLDTHGRGEDVFRLTTDGEGWRGCCTLGDADVVVFGDSFAFGYGVDDADFYADVDPDLAVKPIASPAYSMVHGLLWMRRLADRLGDKTVVWLVYCGNDLSDNLHPDIGNYRMPFARRRPDGSWEVATDHVSPEPWTFASPPRDNDRLFAELCTPSPYQERVFGAADFLIGEAAAVCRDAGARLVVVTIPPTTQVTDPARLRALAGDPARVDLGVADRRLAESCAARGLELVPLLPRLTPAHYWTEDMHWNAAGHRLAAAVVAEVHGRQPRATSR